MPETSLYPAVKRFLEAASFDVKGEVKGCDIVAVRAGEGLTLTIVEMKLGFTLDLLLQVTDRMRAADEVWLAVPATPRGRDRDPPRAPSLPAPRLWSHGGQCHARSGGSAGRAGPLSAKARSSPTQTVAASGVPRHEAEEKDFRRNEKGRQWCRPLRFTPELD